MLNRYKLRAAWVAKGYTQAEVAKKVGLSEITFSRRMKNGCFGTDEAKIMIDYLDIKDPNEIFFAD